MSIPRVLALACALATATSAFAGSMSMRQLPRTDDFRKAADAIATRLRDDVISTGSVDVGAMTVVGAPDRALTAKELSTLNLDLAAQLAKMHQDTPPADLAKHTSVESFGGKAVETAGKRLSDVYAYSPGSDAEAKLAKTVWVLIGKAGVTKANGKVVTSRSRFYDKGTQSHKYFTVEMFMNTETGHALVLYMITGTM